MILANGNLNAFWAETSHTFFFFSFFFLSKQPIQLVHWWPFILLFFYLFVCLFVCLFVFLTERPIKEVGYFVN